jgi:uncharacterized protein
MIIQDPLYGEHEFREPVLIELINSAPIQRLKNINQFGIPDKWYYVKNYSRFEHCVGTAILLAKLGAPLKVQIAGLLHDAGHTAFSHVVDLIFSNSLAQDLNDRLYFQTISQGEISQILNNHKISPETIKDIKDFPILKRSIPFVCADTLDYGMREMLIKEKHDLAEKTIKNITVHENKIVFTSRAVAREYADNFLDSNKNHWADPESVTRYAIFAEILRIALRENLITKQDLLTKTDNDIIPILEQSNLPAIQERLHQLEQKKIDLISDKTKIRYCDPEFLENGKVCILSQVDQEFKEKIDNISKL